MVNVNLRPISHNNNYFMNNNIKNKINVYDEEINMAFSAHYQSGVEEPDKESCVWKR